MTKEITAETREKMRLAQLGKKQSAECIAKRVAKTTGQKRTVEAKEKMRLARLGRKPSTKTREKLQAASIEAWKRPEFREKQRLASKKNWERSEFREKMRLASIKMCGKPEHREKQRLGRTGKKHSAESRRNMSMAAAKRIMAQRGNERWSNWGKIEWFFSQKNNLYVLSRSSYEKQAFEILEQMDDVKFYEVEKIRIPYVDKETGFIRHTIPDILVTYQDGHKQIIEVKAEYLMDRCWERIEVMKSYAVSNGWEFALWTEKRLKGKTLANFSREKED